MRFLRNYTHCKSRFIWHPSARADFFSLKKNKKKKKTQNAPSLFGWFTLFNLFVYLFVWLIYLFMFSFFIYLFIPNLFLYYWVTYFAFIHLVLVLCFYGQLISLSRKSGGSKKSRLRIWRYNMLLSHQNHTEYGPGASERRPRPLRWPSCV